nr:fructose-1,6-bisphosphatase [Synechococcus elongatus PCC 7942 = FACHB-805]
MAQSTTSETHTRDLDRDCTTLSRHVLEQFQSFSPEAQDLAALMQRIGLAAKLIARRLSHAGLVDDALGFTGEINVQGEASKRMDVYANQVFISVFRQSGLVCRLASEEMEKPYYIPENCPIGRYTLLYDPLDGSANVDVDLNVGSIFAVRRQEFYDESHEAKDLLQPGDRQIAAGYVLYGASTLLVYSMGQGVHVFVLDPSLGEFVLAQSDIQLPNSGQIYSVNEGNFCSGPKVSPVHPGNASPRRLQRRYSGALVADFHRILMQGGVFLYPETVKNPTGKLRLLYEAPPMAFLAEQAGGKASDGQKPILLRQPQALHRRCPLIIGSAADVDFVDSLLG